MKLRNEFLTHRSGDEAFIVPADSTKFSGLIRGNATFGDIVDLLKHDTTEDAVVNALIEKYNAPEDTIRRDVSNVINTLKEAGVLAL